MIAAPQRSSPHHDNEPCRIRSDREKTPDTFFPSIFTIAGAQRLVDIQIDAVGDKLAVTIGKDDAGTAQMLARYVTKMHLIGLPIGRMVTM